MKNEKLLVLIISVFQLFISSCNNESEREVDFNTAFLNEILIETNSEDIVVNYSNENGEKSITIKFINSKYGIPNGKQIEALSDSLVFVFFHSKIPVDTLIDKYIFSFNKGYETNSIEYNIDEIYVAFSFVFIQQKDFTNALTSINKAFKLNPIQPASTIFNKSYILYELGKYEESIDNLKYYLSINNEYSKNALILLAKNYLELGMEKENAEIIDTLLSEYTYDKLNKISIIHGALPRSIKDKSNDAN